MPGSRSAASGRGRADYAELCPRRAGEWQFRTIAGVINTATMRADLVVWSRTLNSGSRVHRDLAKTMLALGQDEPDLAGLRERIGPRAVPRAVAPAPAVGPT